MLKLNAVKMLVVVLVVTLNGCATITTGTTQPLTFQSVPSGAEVVINGVSVGRTPLSLNVKKSGSTRVILKKEGYVNHTLIPSTKLNGLFWGNIICGAFFGSTTDGASGAAVLYAPDQYFVTLEPGDSIPKEIKKLEKDEADVKQFILVNHDSLTKDLMAGDGEFLKALLTRMEVHNTRHNSATKKIKSLYTESNDREHFADGVVKEFTENKYWKRSAFAPNPVYGK